ncbi:ribonuclease T2-like [Scomber scombrus]|uniref:Ribonuclease T2-like n=1 Tax=Scomber scombrus TaxID=13677 RepID=A0AAV1QJA0_SCOSC
MRCCDCWRMFQSDVQELKDELDEHWPSLVKKRSSFMFWKEEWEKHGACAACVEGMNSPLRYFQICLKLRAQFDFHKLRRCAASWLLFWATDMRSSVSQTMRVVRSGFR